MWPLVSPTVTNALCKGQNKVTWKNVWFLQILNTYVSLLIHFKPIWNNLCLLALLNTVSSLQAGYYLAKKKRLILGTSPIFFFISNSTLSVRAKVAKGINAI